MAIGGIAFLLIDTAGLRETGDEIEAIGVDRARASAAAADIVLWLGDPSEAPAERDPGPCQGRSRRQPTAAAGSLRLRADRRRAWMS